MSSTTLRVVWSTKQKKKLLNALSEYPPDAYENLAKRIPGKDAKDVEEYITEMKQDIKRKEMYKGVRKEVVDRAPLEEWLDISRDLVEFEHVDSSTNLIKVMSLISNFEDLPAPEEPDGPDYRKIYKFLFQALQTDRHEDIVTLNSIESAIMLDMLHSLMDVLCEHDTTVHRNVMRWKYQLMEQRDRNGHVVIDSLRRASENDFTAFIEDQIAQRKRELDREKIYMARRAAKEFAVKPKSSEQKIIGPTSAMTSKTQGRMRLPFAVAQTQSKNATSSEPSGSQSTVTVAGETPPSSGIAPPTSAEPPPRLAAAQPTSTEASPRGGATHPTSMEAPPRSGVTPNLGVDQAVDTRLSSSAIAPFSATRLSGKSPENTLFNNVMDAIEDPSPRRRHKPGRKGALDPPETPRTEIYLVMPPKGVEIVNYVPRPKKTARERVDGKYKALNQEEELIDNDLSKEITYDVHRSELEQFQKASKKDVLVTKLTPEEKKRKMIEAEKQNERVLSFCKKKKDDAVKKPKLYSLNPFCLPVSLLDLRSKQ